jgi:hypothetical protein
MNATPAVSQAPVNSDPAQTGGAGSADSTRSGTGGQDFAAALSDAAPKQAARKPIPNKVHGGRAGGGQLPVPGTLSPPAPSSVASPPGAGVVAAAAAAALAAASASAAAGAQGVGGNAKPGAAADPALAAPAGAQPGAASGVTSGFSPDAALQPAVNPRAPDKGLDPTTTPPGGTGAAGVAAGFAQALGLPGAEAASAADSTTTGAAVEDAGGRPAIAQTVGASVSNSPAGTTAGSAVKPLTGVAATAATTAATSGPSTADGGASTTPDATTQAPSAAALAAAVSGAVASSDAGYSGAADSASSVTDDLATPATGGAALDGDGSNGSAAPVQAGAMAHAAAAAVTTPINAQAVAALAGAATPDKHSQDGSANSLLTDTSGNSVAGTAQMSSAAGVASDVAPTPTLKVSAAVETPEFGQGLADRVSWMVDNNMNGAKLQVNPPQLGPIEVRIAVQGDHAQVWLTSHSAVTRDALEASSPKLRDMLSSQGFGQVSVDISQRSFQERSSQAQPYDWTPAVSRGASAASQSAAAVSVPRISSGAVDAYA